MNIKRSIELAGHYIRRARSLPTRVAIGRAIRLVRVRLGNRIEVGRDIRNGTYLQDSDIPSGRLTGRIGRTGPCRPPGNVPTDIIERFLTHRFSLLGSEWVHAKYGADCPGFGQARYKMSPTVTADPQGQWLRGRVVHSNLAESQRIWAMIELPYEPIDWHVDLRSGYRWPAAAHSLEIEIAPRHGADIKLPWELARMQHLPEMALASAQSGRNSDISRRCSREFRNQVVDFLATNPPRFGVNWACTMDVAIRLANWLIAWDLFNASGHSFDPTFERLLLGAVWQHCLHVSTHLEWHEDVCDNHYLAGIAGLLLGACYLPRTVQVDDWVAHSVRELVVCVGEQFHEDGSNFEASTSYHRLSAQMVAFATAMILGLDEERKGSFSFPPWYVQRVAGMSLFLSGSDRGDGQLPQIGDNDSGFFVKLQPLVRERLNDHRCLVHAIDALFEKHLNGAYKPSEELSDAWLIRQLSRGVCLASPLVSGAWRPVFTTLPGQDEASSVVAWRNFGLYVLRMKDAYLAVRCGGIGQRGRGGHAHNDQLSFELAVGCKPVLVDPGTFTYTPDLNQRNRFRSTAMHNTAFVRGVEQNLWPPGLPGAFRMFDKTAAEVLEIGPGLFKGRHQGILTVREVRLSPERLCGTDQIADEGEKWISFHFAPGFTVLSADSGGVSLLSGDLTVRISGGPGDWMCDQDLYSPSYGTIQPAWTVRLTTADRQARWEVAWWRK